MEIKPGSEKEKWASGNKITILKIFQIKRNNGNGFSGIQFSDNI